jgi:hypothetical protein
MILATEARQRLRDGKRRFVEGYRNLEMLNDGLVVGADYLLETGALDFFDGVPMGQWQTRHQIAGGG